MEDAVWGFLGVIAGGAITTVGVVITIAGNYFMESKKYKLNQKSIWAEKRYTSLKQMLLILDRLILFTYNSEKNIYRLEEINGDSETEYNEICKLRKEIIPDILILFDSSVKQDFEQVFNDVYEGQVEKLRNGKETEYKDIADEVNAFADKVREKYFNKMSEGED